MYNMTKMEFYRLFKLISTWVILAVVVATAVFSAFMTKLDLDMMQSEASAEKFFDSQNIVQYDEYNEYDESELSVGIYVDTNYDWLENDVNAAEYTLIILQSGMHIILTAIFTAIFVHAENRNGYIKNIAGQVTFKGKLVLVKLPALLLFNIIMFVVAYFANMLFVRIFIGSIDFSITADTLKLILIQLLLHFAFSCVIMLLTSVFKSKAISITVGVIFASGVGMLLWNGINAVVNRLFDNSTFDIGKYTIIQNVHSVGMGFDFNDAARIILVGLFFVVITTGITNLVANNRDVG